MLLALLLFAVRPAIAAPAAVSIVPTLDTHDAQGMVSSTETTAEVQALTNDTSIEERIARMPDTAATSSAMYDLMVRVRSFMTALEDVFGAFVQVREELLHHFWA